MSTRNSKTAQRQVEAGLMDMLDRMQTGRFKVFKELNDWWEEFRLYHRKDGRVVKEGDDLMAATRYALMMLRFARTEKQRRDFHREIVYPDWAGSDEQRLSNHMGPDAATTRR